MMEGLAMAVYGEGFHCLELIEKASVQIYSDACDFGAPTKQGDALWNAAKQLIEWYGDKGSRHSQRCETGRTVQAQFTLIDEWAVSDERKTEQQATEHYRIEFISCTTGKCKGKDGYITVYFLGTDAYKEPVMIPLGMMQSMFINN